MKARFLALALGLAGAAVLFAGPAAADPVPTFVGVSPANPVQSVGNPQCITAAPVDGSTPLAGVPITFKTVIGSPNAVGPEVRTSDASGEAVFCYTGTNGGGDFLIAFYDANGDGDDNDGNNTVGSSIRWLRPNHNSITPVLPVQTVGHQQCFTSTALDAFLNVPVPNVPITFLTVIGSPNAVGPEVRTTNASGDAEFCYTGTNGGGDFLIAFYDANGDGVDNDANNTLGSSVRWLRATHNSITPVLPVQTVGHEQCVTSTALDGQLNVGVPDTPITFLTVAGSPNAIGPTVRTTNSAGDATFCYTGTNGGGDFLIAFYDANGDGVDNDGNNTLGASVRWLRANHNTITPLSPVQTVGHEQCVTSTGLDGLLLNVGVPDTAITFLTVAGSANAVGPAIRTTNAAGEATFCYTGANGGVDFLIAFYDANGDGVDNDGNNTMGSTIRWLKPGQITLTPASATLPVGQTQCVTAHATDALLNSGVPGADLTFRTSPSSANIVAPTTRTTDANGDATFCYTGTHGGSDDLVASFASVSGHAAIQWTVPLTIIGFLRPVDNSSSGIVNVAKAGSTVPLKFQVKDASGTYVTDIAIVTSFTAGKVACDSSDIPEDVITSTGGTSLRYDFTANQFIQNWKTPTTPGQCYRAVASFVGGQKLVADFKLK